MSRLNGEKILAGYEEKRRLCVTAHDSPCKGTTNIKTVHILQAACGHFMQNVQYFTLSNYF